MSYYDTIAEDLEAARKLARGWLPLDGQGDPTRDILGSLVAEVERLQQLLQNYIDHIDTSRLPAIAAAAGRRVEELEQQIKDIQSARTVFGDVKGRDLDLILGPSQASITCPDCKRTSYNRNDVKHRYCGFCHKSIDPL